MTATSNLVTSRGHWRFRYSPADYADSRIPYAELRATVDRERVQLRSIDFPHRVRNLSEALHGARWIGLDIEKPSRVESWRFYQSGQFVFLGAIWTDHITPVRPDSPLFSTRHPPSDARVLPVAEMLFTLTECFEFARRLSVSPVGAERLAISFELRNTEGRVLWVDDPTRSSFDHVYQFHEPTLLLRREPSRGDLLGNAWVLAVDLAMEVFERFGWQAPRHMIEGQQAQLRR